jgi:hypothetical protein
MPGDLNAALPQVKPQRATADGQSGTGGPLYPPCAPWVLT